MDMRLLYISLLISILALSASCSNSNSGANTQKAEEQKEDNMSQKFSLPAIPSLIKGEERLLYLAEHYWDNYNFEDTSNISDKEYTTKPFFNYLRLLKDLPDDIAKKRFENFSSTIIKQTQKGFLIKFLQLSDEFLDYPNSPVRDNVLYSIITSKALNSTFLNFEDSSRYAFSLNRALLNNRGDKAKNFSFKDAKESVKQLYSITSDYTIIIFYEPDCHSCKEVIELFKRYIQKQKNISIAAIYPSDNREKWIESLKNLPDWWIRGYDYSMEITNNLLYDLRPSPSIYLLDSQKRVILRDCEFAELSKYLNNLSSADIP